MKRLSAFCLCVTLCVTFLSCNKVDWRPASDCDVQQFGAPLGIFYYGPSMGPFPYLFSKTYDGSGNVQTIDAYLFSLGIDFNVKARFAVKGQTLYFIDQANAADTFMVVQVNSKGRPVRAVETRSLYTKSSGYPKFIYEFTYKNNKLYNMVTYDNSGRNLSVSANDTCTYDGYGNILTLGRTAAYEYDHTQKPKQQFYFDGDNTNTVVYGFHLMEYLDFFPEITSPPHVRTKQRNQLSRFTGQYFLSFDIANHKFDSKGKLISYSYGNQSTPPEYLVTTPIIYNCDAQGKSAK